MYAIIHTGGKQYRVQEGDVVEVELIPGNEGDEVEFNQVNMVKSDKGVQVGTPFVPKCSVKGLMLGEMHGDKVVAYKFKRRQGYHRKVGHRQRYSRVKITQIAS